MARHAALMALGAVAALAVPTLLVMEAAVGDHSCPYFERKRFDFVHEEPLGGDLFAVEHLVGFADFQECHQLRLRLTSADVRFESRGGAYALHVVGEGFDDVHALRAGANRTQWYDLQRLESIEYGGVSREGTPVVETGLRNASLQVLRSSALDTVRAPE